jgi:hypothetical protein
MLIDNLQLHTIYVNMLVYIHDLKRFNLDGTRSGVDRWITYTGKQGVILRNKIYPYSVNA